MTTLADRVAEATAPNSLERVFQREEGIRLIIGVDEVGCGPLAGPLTASACCFKLPIGTFPWEKRIRDSKKLNESVREDLYTPISKYTYFGIGESSPQEVDIEGTNKANCRAMSRAVRAVLGQLKKDDKKPDLILFDGNLVPPNLGDISTSCRVMALPRADDRSIHVGAASILAKVSRDRYMKRVHKRWPEYEFSSNKGYGTKAHRKAIKTHGPCPIHRETFGCVREYVQKEST